ncbi:MAG: sulfopyruvate decarboxylase subunit alpha [Planctomycetes bacterium]|nr:sulfopyruvate decarboxylase subunit alpha [Planctomycetota bacterium]
MIPAKTFWSELKRRDFRFFSGVPCSILTEALEALPADPELTYVPAVREDVALGVASGATLAGRRSAILIQNSGLGHIVNPLTSYSLMYEVPILLIITWRGFQGKDAPEHLLMGDRMTGFLDLMGVPYAVLDDGNLASVLDRAVAAMDSSQKPFALLVKKGSIG